MTTKVQETDVHGVFVRAWDVYTLSRTPEEIEMHRELCRAAGGTALGDFDRAVADACAAYAGLSPAEKAQFEREVAARELAPREKN